MTLTQVTKAGLDEIALDHVFTIGASGTSAYTFQGEGLNGTVNNPTLYLTRGKTYRFENGSGGHPLRIQSTTGQSGTAYNTGVTNNNTTGTVIVEVQHDAPDVLYYQCTSHAAMNGILYITGALSDGGVTEAKIASNAVTTNKISTNAVTTTKIAADAITNALIADNAVENANIADNAVTGPKISTGAVSLNKLATDSVGTAKIIDASVTLAKLEHGTSSNDGKFLRANNGADPTFETVDFTNLNASNLTSGTIPDARFPSTLPAISGANLTGIVTATTAINTQSSAYTLVASDAGKVVHLSNAITIPNSVFSAGQQVTLINNTSSDQTLFTGSGLTVYNVADATTPTGDNILFSRRVARLFFITGSIAYLEGASSVPTFTASNSSNIVLATVFGSSDWASNKPKIYIVPSGVTVGGTNAGGSAILVSSGMGGTLRIDVSGTVIGKGGTGGAGGAGAVLNVSNQGATGQAGSHAIQVDSANVTVHNNSGGQISGGGGGGGGGGAGGWRAVGFSQIRGGNGGTGGNGEGYNQSQSNGSSGENYHVHSGNGGAGGNGGTLGNIGSNGSAGQGGSPFNGSAGNPGGGGAAGKAIWSNNGNSWTNGTTSGTYHGSYT